MQDDKIVWEAPEYLHQEKSRDWFIAFGIIALALFIVALLFKNTLFAIVIILSAFTAMLHAKRPPDTLTYEVNRVGIVINRRFYPYSFLYSFWVDRTDSHTPKLLITSKKMLLPMIIVPLGDQNPDVLRDFIANYLPEQELLEPLSHKILESLGF